MTLTLLNLDGASVCGQRAEKVARRRRDGGNGVEAQRRRRATDGNPPLLPLVTSVRFCGVERAWSRGILGDRQPVKRSKPRVGRGGLFKLQNKVVIVENSTVKFRIGKVWLLK
jgi:hypothetical protein